MGAFVTLKNSREFSKVYAYKKSYANKYLIMYIRKNSLDYNRIGISASKKIGNSVVRHRGTRLIREVYRLNEEKVAKGYDIVIIPRKGMMERTYKDIESAFIHLLKLHKILNKSNYRNAKM